MTSVKILTEALARRGLAYVSESEMTQLLSSLGLSLTGGARQTAEAHLQNHEQLGTGSSLLGLLPKTVG